MHFDLRYRVLLGEKYAIVRQGVRSIIESLDDFEVVGDTADGLELLTLARQLKPDLVVLSISMLRLRGIEVIHEMRNIEPHPKILILTGHSEMELVGAALAAGANGYILKEDTGPELLHAMEVLRQGGTYLSPRLFEGVTATWVETLRGNGKPSANNHSLTVRQSEILKLTAEGNSSRQIAKLLHISPRTVEHHRANIMAKLDLRRSIDLVRYAHDHGYLLILMLCEVV